MVKIEILHSNINNSTTKKTKNKYKNNYKRILARIVYLEHWQNALYDASA